MTAFSALTTLHSDYDLVPQPCATPVYGITQQSFPIMISLPNVFLPIF
jgi:hypothetical protein